jgi:hypothetical protein
MEKKKSEIEVQVVFTEGWEERFTKAAYEYWIERKKDERKKELLIAENIDEVRIDESETK